MPAPRIIPAAGAVDPEHRAGQLALLYDGATVAARMDQNPGVGATAREIAATLVDAATGPGAVGIDCSKKGSNHVGPPESPVRILLDQRLDVA